MLAYNCSPSFNWKKKLDDATIAKFQRELGAMGYKFQFITLAGFHALNLQHVRAGARLQGKRHDGLLAAAGEGIRREKHYGYGAAKHQRFVGTGYFDDVTQVIAGGRLLDHGAERLDRRRTVHA